MVQQKSGRYADVRVDLAFKKCFGSEQHKLATIGLINAMIPGINITDVKFEPTELQGLSTEDRRGVIDVLCESADGSNFIVEMQRSPQPFFRERALYYSSLYLLNQAKVGDWDFMLKPAYVIAFIDFPMSKWGVDTSARSIPMARYTTADPLTGEKLPGSAEFYFFDLPSFLKKEEEIADNQEYWLYLLRNSSTLAEKPKKIRGAEFEEFFVAAEIAGFTKEERIQYETDMITQRDMSNALHYAKVEGKAEGRIEGKAEGLAEGEAKGRTEGKAEGRIEGIADVAKKMLAAGVDVSDIQKFTGLTKEEVEKL